MKPDSMIVHARNMLTQDSMSHLYNNFSPTFDLNPFFGHEDNPSLDEVQDYSICALLLSEYADYCNSTDSILIMLCTELSIEDKLEVQIELKPQFLFFIYGLCILLIIPLILHQHYKQRAVRRLRLAMSKTFKKVKEQEAQSNLSPTELSVDRILSRRFRCVNCNSRKVRFRSISSSGSSQSEEEVKLIDENKAIEDDGDVDPVVAKILDKNPWPETYDRE
ncbi:hypothetical protein ACOME3_004675 [Neoechinorhynchus agilis]